MWWWFWKLSKGAHQSDQQDPPQTVPAVASPSQERTAPPRITWTCGLAFGQCWSTSSGHVADPFQPLITSADRLRKSKQKILCRRKQACHHPWHVQCWTCEPATVQCARLSFSFLRPSHVACSWAFSASSNSTCNFSSSTHSQCACVRSWTLLPSPSCASASDCDTERPELSSSTSISSNGGDISCMGCDVWQGRGRFAGHAELIERSVGGFRLGRDHANTVGTAVGFNFRLSWVVAFLDGSLLSWPGWKSSSSKWREHTFVWAFKEKCSETSLRMLMIHRFNRSGSDGKEWKPTLSPSTFLLLFEEQRGTQQCWGIPRLTERSLLIEEATVTSVPSTTIERKMLGAVFEHQLGLRAVFAHDVMITKCERPISRERLNFRRRPILCTTLYRNLMRASNFGGTFDQLFLWICSWNFHRRCLSTFSIPRCKKSQKWPKTQIKGGPALKTICSFERELVCFDVYQVSTWT